MRRILSVACMMAATAAMALAGFVIEAPEIDPGSAVSALALLGGVMVVIRGRRGR